MAGLVNGPLSLFRKTDSSKPLHARWGDVSISVPTDGSWNQYDNPHRPITERSAYGPGYVPDCSPQDRRNPRSVKEEDPDDDARSVCSEASTVSWRSSLSLKSLRPGRLSVHLASRPKPLRGESQVERDAQRSEQKRNEFAYRPIYQDYTSEVVESTNRSSNRFKYIPTNGRYPQSSGAETPRSQSVNSLRTPHSLSESSERRYSGRDRDHYTPTIGGSTCHEDDFCGLHSTSVRDSSDSSGSWRNYGLPPRRRTSPFVAADGQRASSISKPMTLTMVPDPDDLYG
ncbi:RmlC-like cupin domain-containing protein [Penicillium digitatum]|uniref:Uncharacterized protein n=3 Tax=Penicillium digitatum TaxID=36651 RepID=K9G5G4_PEND2|nr:hypothetical protein PDIP_88280 [Penicillium digitatum Pd1]EKV04320.1 hypothetical protein PDIP_88280 [Penicillium digitatum Pd1]EKV17190.1 hypothetical protein PDIG_16770 [Penicillium digitatum PHI26]KAG0153157.1 hypothetical protein PDIDSM_5007 [Penicillium digitatum]QQK39769.1 RmlC-like cupin domain-containing protein [Penicillium digitatum]